MINKVLLIQILILMLVFTIPVLGIEIDKIEDPNLPESWYKTPKVASELGIKSFNQSPMLDEKVEEGELPSVSKRLPVDPPVVEPYNKIGKYGGTLNRWMHQLGYLSAWDYLHYSAIHTTPGGNFVPNYIKDWVYSNDYKKLTFYLREGLKWSDGQPFTADDIMYWWEHVANNIDLTPVPPEKQEPPLLNVTSKDKWTVTYHYGRSVPHEHASLANRLGIRGATPAHYMKQFHPNFVGEDKAQKMAEEKDLENWYELYQRVNNDSPSHPEYQYVRPVLSPYKGEKRTETTLILERNPFYPFVDTKGNQLPYIDRIRYNLANDMEMTNTKIATGESDFAYMEPIMQNIPLYKHNEGEEGYTVLMYQRTYGGLLNLYLNQSIKDEKLRNVFQDLRFRKAISFGINRERINDKVFFGLAVPSQETVPPTCEYYKPEFAKAYVDYDPERARKYLDDMGMVDVNNDGFREDPDGNKFSPILLYSQQAASMEYFTPVLELVKADWKEIGINIRLKQLSYELCGQRQQSSNWEISCWIGASTTMFGKDGSSALREYAPFGSWNTQWGDWANWYTSQGEEGVEPSPKVKQLREWAEISLYSTDKEERDKANYNLLKSQADNLWMIGTVSMGVQPVIISNSLHNVPQKGHFDWLSTFLLPYQINQFYLEE